MAAVKRLQSGSSVARVARELEVNPNHSFISGSGRSMQGLIRRFRVRAGVKLADLSRATYYRFDPEAVLAVQDVAIRDRIQRIALQFPAYGRPGITAELQRQGWEVNHKRVGPHYARGQPAVPAEKEVSR